MSDTTVYERAAHTVGDTSSVMTASDVFTGWQEYCRQYETQPDRCHVTRNTIEDIYMDSVLRDIVVTRETIFMTPSVDPQRNLELFEDRVGDDVFGLLMGMELVIDNRSDDHVALLYEKSHDIEYRSVTIRG